MKKQIEGVSFLVGPFLRRDPIAPPFLQLFIISIVIDIYKIHQNSSRHVVPEDCLAIVILVTTPPTKRRRYWATDFDSNDDVRSERNDSSPVQTTRFRKTSGCSFASLEVERQGTTIEPCWCGGAVNTIAKYSLPPLKIESATTTIEPCWFGGVIYDTATRLYCFDNHAAVQVPVLLDPWGNPWLRE